MCNQLPLNIFLLSSNTYFREIQINFDFLEDFSSQQVDCLGILENEFVGFFFFIMVSLLLWKISQSELNMREVALLMSQDISEVCIRPPRSV